MIVRKQLQEGTLLPPTSINATLPKMKFVNFDTITFHVIATAVTIGATVAIERSLDGNNWKEVASLALAANGLTEVLVKGEVALYYRAVVSALTDGTYAVEFNAA